MHHREIILREAPEREREIAPQETALTQDGPQALSDRVRGPRKPIIEGPSQARAPLPKPRGESREQHVHRRLPKGPQT